MQAASLREHVSCMLNLLDKTYTASWGSFREDLDQLMLALDKYAEFLDKANKSQQDRQKKDHPVRELKQHIYIQHFDAAEEDVPEMYKKLDDIIGIAEVDETLIFDESIHLSRDFRNRMERHRFFKNFQLTVPVDMIR